VPLNPEAAQRLEAWLEIAGIRADHAGPLLRPMNAARGNGMKGFATRPMSRRAVQKLVEGYVRRLKLDPSVTVHSFRGVGSLFKNAATRCSGTPTVCILQSKFRNLRNLKLND
jgi:integrase